MHLAAGTFIANLVVGQRTDRDLRPDADAGDVRSFHENALRPKIDLPLFNPLGRCRRRICDDSIDVHYTCRLIGAVPLLLEDADAPAHVHVVLIGHVQCPVHIYDHAVSDAVVIGGRSIVLDRAAVQRSSGVNLKHGKLIVTGVPERQDQRWAGQGRSVPDVAPVTSHGRQSPVCGESDVAVEIGCGRGHRVAGIPRCRNRAAGEINGLVRE